MGEHPVADHVQLAVDLPPWYKFVGLLPVAASMCQLQVVDVARVSAFSQGDNVVNRRAERMRILQGEVHRLSADSADGLCSEYSFSVLLELCAVLAVLVRSVTCRHKYLQRKRPGGHPSLLRSIA